jgi:hypothetical protein
MRSGRRAPLRHPTNATQRRARRRRHNRVHTRPSPPSFLPEPRNAVPRPLKGAGVFDKMSKESCPYHKRPVKHSLDECDMLQRFYNKLGPSTEGGNKKAPDDGEDNKGDGFPDVHNCYMIFGGEAANLSSRQRKQERQEVFSVEVATPIYLDWSDRAIMSHSVLEGKPNANHIRARIRNSRTHRLHNWTSSHIAQSK